MWKNKSEINHQENESNLYKDGFFWGSIENNCPLLLIRYKLLFPR